MDLAAHQSALHLLLLTDSAARTQAVRGMLGSSELAGATVANAATAQAALALCRGAAGAGGTGPGVPTVDAVLVDAETAGLDVPALLCALAEPTGFLPSLPVIVLTGQDDEQFAAELLAAGAQDVLAAEELTPRRLARAVKAAIARHAAPINLHKPTTADITELDAHLLQKVIRGLLTTALAVVYVFDVEEGRNLYLSAQATGFLGYTPAEIADAGSSFVIDIMHPDDAKGLPAHLQELASSDQPVIYEYRLRHKNGEWCWFQSQHTVIERMPDEQPRRMLGVAYEVTAYKRTEELLSAQAEALAQVGDAIVMIDNEQRIVYLNNAAAAQYETNPEVARGLLLANLYEYIWLKPDDERAAMNALAHTGRWRGENIHVLRSGRRLHVESEVTVLHDRNGAVTGMLAVIRDITVEKQVETALRAQAEWQRLALEGAQLGTWATDVVTGEALWDERCRRIFGVGQDEPASAEKGFSIIHPDDRARAMQAYAAAVAPGSDGVYREEKRIIWPDGSIHWIATQGQTIFAEGEAGRTAQRLVGIVMDVTERKHMEQALREAEARFRLAVEKTPMGFAHLDRNLRYMWVYNPHGDFAQGLVGADANTVIGQLQAPDYLDDLHAVLETGKGKRGEYTLQFSDGPHVYDITLQPLHDAEGSVSGLTLAALDITERKRAEEQVRRNEERLRRMMQTSQVGIAFGRSNGDVIECNNALLEMLGLSRADFAARGINWRGISVPQDAVRDDEDMQRLAAGGRLAPFEKQLRRDDGSLLAAMISLVQLEGADPQHADEHVAFVVDLTELKQAQAALKELNNSLEQRVRQRTAELERSNRELDRFAYIASHDLKSPLRAIDNLATWISEDAGNVLPSSSRGHLDKLRRRIRRLEYLLEDLLLYSRAGREHHAPEPIDCNALVQDIVELINVPAGFAITTANGLPTLIGERPPLETVFRNLIENAVKHHDRPSQGHVVISSRDLGEFVEFTVADDGPGIEPQYHERIFEVFQTLRPRDEVEGSGMGLAIVKKTVESAGGVIHVQSQPNAGAAFTFTWPQTQEL